MERIEIMIWEKISLVVPEREDVKVWYKGINDIENQIFLNQRWALISLEAEYEYYDKLKTLKNQKTFSIMIRENGKIIWNVSLMEISDKNRNAEMWIMICDKTEQNKGYWTEAVELILKYWFEVLGLHKIRLLVLSTNSRAKYVYEKIWFRETWIFMEEIWDWEKYIDKIFMEIFRKDFM